MSEYVMETFGIVQDFADLHGDMNTPLYQAIMDVMESRQREEIVRCKDCKWSFHSELFPDINTRYCRWFARDVYIDMGFCFWGERKGEEDGA